MKFIDKKGRLFGLINIIDLAVILIIIASGVTIYAGYRNIQKKRYDFVETIFYIRALYENIPRKVASAIKIGDRELNYAEIADIEISDPKPRPLVVEKMIITFRALCFVKREEAYLNDRVIKIGKRFPFSTLLYNIEGTIISIEEKKTML